MRINKWLGLGAGWVFGGPIGGVIGFAIGAIIDGNIMFKASVGNQTTINDFAMSLIVLIASVVKADGRIHPSEIEFVRRFLTRTFGADAANELTVVLEDILQKDIDVDAVCFQIRDNMDYHSRMEMVHLLFGVSKADGVIHFQELEIIERIARSIGIHENDYNSIKSIFIDDTDWAYKVLNLSPNATVDEIKKSYKRLAIEHHPDKVSYLGEEVQNAAKERFQKINEAYDKIKKERGIV